MKFPRLAWYIFPIILSLCCRGFAQNSPAEWNAGEDLAKKTAKYLFLKVSVDKKEAFTGESILATYRLFVALDIQGQLAKAPGYRGFAVYDMQNGNNESYTVERLNGIYYRVYLIKTAQLFGLKPGTQLLEPVELDATVHYRRKTGLPPGTASATTDTLFNYTAKSEMLGVTIKPLPKNPKNEKPGGVGDFRFSATISRPVIETNKADTLTITLAGKGAWHEISVPKIVWPEGLETFEPAIKETLDPIEIPVKGIRTLQFPVVASKPGQYVVPSMKFTYFDPGKKQFITLETDPVSWTVTPATTQIGPAEEDSPRQNITGLFGKLAVVLFPAAALLLVVLAIFRKRKTQQEDLENGP